MKILLGCTAQEMQTIVDFLNNGNMRCILAARNQEGDLSQSKHELFISHGG